MEPSILHKNPKLPKGQEVISCSDLISGSDTGENRTVCYGLGFDNWWIDPEREASLAQRKSAVK